MNWFIEKLYDDQGYYQELLHEITRCGNIPIVYEEFPEQLNHYSKYSHEKNMIFHGSYQTACEIQEQMSWVPGVIGYPYDQYVVSLLTKNYSTECINNGLYTATLGKFIDAAGEYMRSFGSDCVFIRPDAVDKAFSGQIISQTSLSSFIQSMRIYDVDNDTPVIISHVRNIEYEWRVIYSCGSVVTGCQYSPKYQCGLPQRVIEYCEGIGLYEPDPIFIIDIAESHDRLYLIEMGTFSCSDFYVSDPENIVKKVNEIW